MIQVAFTDFVFERREAIHLDGFQFSIHPPLRTTDEIVAAASRAQVLCMRDQFGNVSREVFERLPDLKFILTRSVGYDHIDLGEARWRGIPVSHVPDYGAHMIAEHAFGLMLAVARNIVRGDERYKRQGLFSDHGLQGIELFGKTLGIIGAGRIGMHMVRLGKGFGMRILAYDIHENQAAASDLGFEYAPLEAVLSESDFISLHVALNPDTQHLIDAKRLTQLKPRAILVNTARGAILDTRALKDAMVSGRLAGAGLDVLEDERDTYHDFGDLNVVVTPHLGWYTDGAVERILKITLDILSAYRRGEILHRLA